MSRRRSSNPTKAISITLPLSLLDEIDDKLTRTQSRSAWIANACLQHLHDNDINIPTRQLMAMLHARIDRLVFAVRDERFGAAGSQLNLLESPFLNHRCKVESGILETESRELLTSFFKARREKD